MASLHPRANEEIPKSNKTLAGFILLLLLALSSSHVLVQWTGLEKTNRGTRPFQRALKLHTACLIPLLTPARFSQQDLDADMLETTAQDSGPSQDIDSQADLKPAALTMKPK